MNHTFAINAAAFVQLMADTGLSLYDLEALTEIYRSTLRRWKNGKTKRARLENIELVAAALGVKADALISAKGNPDLRRAPRRAENEPQPRWGGVRGNTVAETTADALAVLAKG